MWKRMGCVVLAIAVMACGVSAEAAKGKGKKSAKSPEKRFARLDTNNDGKLSEQEFVANQPADKQAKAKKRFTKIDKDGDGFVTVEEIKAAAKTTKRPAAG